MNPEETTPPAVGPGQSIPWFEAHLASRGRSVIRGGRLDQELTFTKQLARSMRGDRMRGPGLEALLESFMRATGMDALTKSLHRAHLAGYVVPDERLDGLVSSNPNPFIAAANDRERNKSWELFVATQLALVGDVEHDETCDLIATIDGRRVAVAAKVPYSTNDGQLWKCILDGVEQTARVADAEVDLVVANYVQRLDDRATLYRRSHQMGFRFVDQDLASDWAQQAAIEICDSGGQPGSELHRAVERIQRRTREGTRPNRPIGVVFFMPVVVCIEARMMVFAYPHMPATTGAFDFEVGGHLCRTLSGVLSPVV